MTHPQNESIGHILTHNLSQGAQETIDHAIDEVSRQFKAVKNYVRENPGEAALIAASAGLAAYVLLNTKPGRKAFDLGLAIASPELQKLFSKNFGKPTN